MSRLLISAILLAVSGCSANSPMELTEREQAEQTERCMQLKQEVESLKDYPLRRTTAREYYNQECLQ